VLLVGRHGKKYFASSKSGRTTSYSQCKFADGGEKRRSERRRHWYKESVAAIVALLDTAQKAANGRELTDCKKQRLATL
jgi:hypothetical protein